jgi:hypothetical protein
MWLRWWQTEWRIQGTTYSKPDSHPVLLMSQHKPQPENKQDTPDIIATWIQRARELKAAVSVAAIRSIVDELQANVASTALCESEAVLDNDLKPTGKRMVTVTIQGELEDSMPSNNHWGNARTSDGSVVIRQRQEVDGDGLIIIKSKITVTPVSGNDDEARAKASKVLSELPFTIGFRRVSFDCTPVYDETSLRLSRIDVGIVDKQICHT